MCNILLSCSLVSSFLKRLFHFLPLSTLSPPHAKATTIPLLFGSSLCHIVEPTVAVPVDLELVFPHVCQGGCTSLVL